VDFNFIIINAGPRSGPVAIGGAGANGHLPGAGDISPPPEMLYVI
jgi:hypothetical protein